jgi:glycosyltransferase involved in cell wall biosynthesis
MVARLSHLVGARFCFMTASLLDCRDQLAQEGHPWLYKVYHWGLQRADMVVCQNEDQQRLLRENFGIVAKVLRPACAPVEDESPRVSAERNRWILWVGRCDPYKDPLSFIRLARELPEIPFRMIMPPSVRPAHEREVQAELSGLSNLLVSRGLPFHEMETVFRSASVLVNTSTLEGFPNSFLEAMRVGVPILSYRLDPGGVLMREGAGICAQGDFRSLVDLCRDWHISPGETRGYGDAGRSYVRRTHDSRVIVEEFEHLLKGEG